MKRADDVDDSQPRIEAETDPAERATLDEATYATAPDHARGEAPRTMRGRSVFHVAGMLAATGVVALVGWKVFDVGRSLPDDVRESDSARETSIAMSAAPREAGEAVASRLPMNRSDGQDSLARYESLVPSAAAEDCELDGSSTGIAVGAGARGRASAPFTARRLAGSGQLARAHGPTFRSGGDAPVTSVAGTESYSTIDENEFQFASTDPLSTFSIDVDTASYSNVRRFLDSKQLPPRDAVRIEELVNYFRYSYPAPEGTQPFSNVATVATCPWAPTHELVQIGLRARDFDETSRAGVNLVFLIDVSGSMESPDKLPLLVRSLQMLVEKLDQRDRIAIVVYAGNSGLVLPSTTCEYKAVLLRALDSLRAGGSTNGGAGIELAYRVATENLLREGQNRVVLCTDGDFNVGVSDHDSLLRLIEDKRKTGVFLSVLGFGTGNVKDSTMEMLADKGNGNYAYVDTLAEARKVLVAEMGGTLFTVAKDVKIQVEFNPARVQAWRLIGYENRKLAARDFNDDTKDAGEIGAGHTVTALYEIVPVDVAFTPNGVDPLRYQPDPRAPALAPVHADELLTLKLRYKDPNGETSRLLTTSVRGEYQSWAATNDDFRFAAAVASFGMVLRQSPNVGNFDLEKVLYLALPAMGTDPTGARAEFVRLVRQARSIVSR